MEKVFILLSLLCFALVGCSQDPKNEISDTITEKGSVTQTEIEKNPKTKISNLELKVRKKKTFLN